MAVLQHSNANEEQGSYEDVVVAEESSASNSSNPKYSYNNPDYENVERSAGAASAAKGPFTCDVCMKDRFFRFSVIILDKEKGIRH